MLVKGGASVSLTPPSSTLSPSLFFLLSKTQKVSLLTPTLSLSSFFFKKHIEEAYRGKEAHRCKEAHRGKEAHRQRSTQRKGK
jgi:hypothetical protein